MMKMKRKRISSRILPILLSTLMMLSTVSAFAEEPSKTAATREYAVANFVEASNRNGSGSLDAFSDVGEVSPEYEEGLKIAVGNGIITGYEDGTLRPKNTIRRIEALVILSRCLPEVQPVRAPLSFTDVPSWAEEDIDRLSSAGLVEGYGDGRLGAEDDLTQDEVSLLVERIKKADSAEENSLSYTQKAPYVTDAMCQAEYWLNADDYKVLLSFDEIEDFNRRTMMAEGTMMNDLENLPDTYAAKQMAEEQAAFESPEGIYLDGEPVEENYYQAIRKNIKNVKVGKSEKVKYAICTAHTEMKAYPYKDWLSDSDWDKEWDNFVNTAVLVGEPLVLYNPTADGAFIYAKSVCCEGWVSTKDVAVCRDKDEWMKAKTHENFLVVTGEKVWLEASYDIDVSQKMLTMGTVLELADEAPFEALNRLPWNNYIVSLPTRQSDGSFAQKPALIPANRDVHIGYLPYTRANVVSQALKSLGNRYGWGGMLSSQDCSSFAREVYLCFGLVLPRNTSWQMAMPAKVTDISGMTDEEKMETLAHTPTGSLLFFRGHEMIYLGEENGRYYTVNNVSSLVDPKDPEGGVIRPRSVIINDLSTLRGNGTTWLSNLICIVAIE